MSYELSVAFFLGILEGVTEWLPISSTGHLLLLDGVLSPPWRPAFAALFLVAVQLGAMCAVPVLFRHRLCPLGRSKDREARHRILALWGKVLIATLPAAVAGLLLDEWLERYLYRPTVVAGALILYGAIFILLEKRKKRAPFVGIAENMPPKTAFLVGIFQMLALVPGTSRSGATMVGALALGVSRPAAAEFSFFLGLPTMMGAGALKGVRFFAEGNTLSGSEALLLFVGCATAFLVSLAAIRFLMELVRRHSFMGFGIYRIVLGGAVLASLIFQ